MLYRALLPYSHCINNVIIVKIIFVHTHRRFEQLCDVMSESDNGQRYQAEIEKLLLAEEPFIPFLGSFLTQVGMQQNYYFCHLNRK